MKATKKIYSTYENYPFESSSSKTPEFSEFARLYKSAIKEQCQSIHAELENVNIGHFFISGFIKKGTKYAYFSISDVRYFPNSFLNNILIRTATGVRDFTGGSNHSSYLKNFAQSINELL